MRHNQSKRVKVFNKSINISITNPVCSRSFIIIENKYSTFFFNLFWKFITTKNITKMFNSKFLNPIKQIKIRQWFVYKIEPIIGIELKGMSFPSNSPCPFPFPLFFFLLPFQLGFPKYHKMEVIDMDSILHHVF